MEKSQLMRARHQIIPLFFSEKCLPEAQEHPPAVEPSVCTILVQF